MGRCRKGQERSVSGFFFSKLRLRESKFQEGKVRAQSRECEIGSGICRSERNDCGLR